MTAELRAYRGRGSVALRDWITEVWLATCGDALRLALAFITACACGIEVSLPSRNESADNCRQ